MWGSWETVEGERGAEKNVYLSRNLKRVQNHANEVKKEKNEGKFR